MKRRHFLTGLATLPLVSTKAAAAEKQMTELSGRLLVSPPVAQLPSDAGVSFTWMVNRLATGWVDWGYTEALGKRVLPSHHGLVSADERCISVQLRGLEAGRSIYYRVGAAPLKYHNAYHIERSEEELGPVRKLQRSDARSPRTRLAVVNDTHEQAATLAGLAQRISDWSPDALLWNGDTCNDFHSEQRLAEICLQPGAVEGQPAQGGWAAERPLFFVPGNHDVRGPQAHSLSKALLPWPSEANDPPGLGASNGLGGRYCFAHRMGPLAIIGLDTGEDKPDARDVFSGMAAYEPYREAQAVWLKAALQQPEIANAPYLLAFSHIPLHGQRHDNHGQGTDGYAGYSGQGQKLWVEPLAKAGCSMVVSGHKHRFRIDTPSDDFPLHQVVGGGPKPADATLIRIDADAKRLQLISENLEGKELGRLEIAPRLKAQT